METTLTNHSALERIEELQHQLQQGEATALESQHREEELIQQLEEASRYAQQADEDARLTAQQFESERAALQEELKRLEKRTRRKSKGDSEVRSPHVPRPAPEP